MQIGSIEGKFFSLCTCGWTTSKSEESAYMWCTNGIGCIPEFYTIPAIEFNRLCK